MAPEDLALRTALREWDWSARVLLSRGGHSAETRTRLEDSRRIVGELSRVLAGEEAGEGTSDRRRVFAALQGGRIQAVCALFACPRAVFVELVATAPWNLAGADARAVRGAGTALVRHARAWSAAVGSGGRVALQAENARCRGFYERLGFARMRAEDLPYTLVPPGARGFSDAVRRVAEGREGPEEDRSPWMLLDPARLASGPTPPASGPVTVPPRAAAGALSGVT